MHRLNDLVCPLVLMIAGHHKYSMDSTWKPETQSENKIEDGTKELSTGQDGNRREEDCQQIPHDLTLSRDTTRLVPLA